MSNQYNQLLESNENLGQNSNYINNINNNNKIYNNQNINMSGENTNNILIEDDYNQNKNNQNPNPNMISSGFDPYLRPPQSLKWRSIMKIDLDLIRNTRDLSLLNSNLENIIYSDITEEDIQSVPEENVIKLIKILQFLNEFLLEQRQIIDNNLVSLEQAGKKLDKKEQDLEKVVTKQKQYIEKLEKDSKERLQQIIEYKNAINELLKGGRNNFIRGKNIKITDINMEINKNMNNYGYNQYNNNYLKTGYKCKYCTGKVFPSEFELKKHLTDIHLITQFNEGQQFQKSPQQVKSQITMPIEVNLQPMNLLPNNNNNNNNSQLEKKLTDMRFEFQNRMHQFEMDKLRNQIQSQKNMGGNGENYKEQIEKMGNAFNDTLKQVLGVLIKNQPEQPKIIKRKKKEKNNKLDEEINLIKGEIAKANLESQEYDSKIINKRNEINILIIKKQELINTGTKGTFIPKKKFLVQTPNNNFILEKVQPQNRPGLHSGPIQSDHDSTDNERKRQKKILNQIAEKTKLIDIIIKKSEEESSLELPPTNFFKTNPLSKKENLDDFYKRYKKRDDTFINNPKINNYYNILPNDFDKDTNVNAFAKKKKEEKIQEVRDKIFKDIIKIPNYIQAEELKELNKDDLIETSLTLFKEMDKLNEEIKKGENKEDEHYTSLKTYTNFEDIKKFIKKMKDDE